jgi:hypothetical protein
VAKSLVVNAGYIMPQTKGEKQKICLGSFFGSPPQDIRQL